MTLQEIQKQALQLPISERWQLVQTLLKSLQQESPIQKTGNLSRLRGIAKAATSDRETTVDYVTYLSNKYQ